MSEDATTPPRRSSRIIQTTLSIKPVRSYKRGYTWTWPTDRLAPSDLDVSEDFDETHEFYAGIYRSDPTLSKSKRKKTEESFRVGDTVLVNTRKGSYPSIGVIVALWQPHEASESEDSDSDGGDRYFYERTSNQPRVRIHWFVQPSELPKVRAPRDHVANEVYYALSSSAVVTANDILAHCSVSDDPIDTLELEDANGDKFCCFYAIDSAKGVFYNFNWDSHRDRALQGSVLLKPKAWLVHPREDDIDKATPSPSKKRTAPQSLKPRKRQRGDGSSGSDQESSSSDDEVEQFEPSEASDSDDGPSDRDASTSPEPTTPRKQRSNGTSSPRKRKRRGGEDDADRIFRTPSKPKHNKALTLSPTKPSAAPTPHSKAALRARQRLKSRRAGSGKQLAAPEFSVTDASALSHLPKDAQLRAMHVLHVGSRPDALPCREEEFGEILEKILVLLEDGSGGCVYISGVPGTGKTATVHAVIRELHAMAKRSEVNPFSYVEINGLKIPEPSAAYGVLWESLSRHDTTHDGHLRISPKEALAKLDRFFSGGGNSGPGSHACVVLMDELDQLVTTKQDVVYNFFNWPTLAHSKLIVLAVANTMDLPERAMTGKVRSRLGMARVDFRPYKREQLEAIVHARLKTATDDLEGDLKVMDTDAVRLAAARVAGVSGDARRVLDVCRRAVEVCHTKQKAIVKAKDIAEVMAEMQNSPTATYLRDCSFHERVMLASVWKCLRRNGLTYVKWDDVAYQHVNLVGALGNDLDSQRRPSLSELLLVLDSLTSTRALLLEDARKGMADGDRSIALNLEETEVLRVLGDTGGPKWRSFLDV